MELYDQVLVGLSKNFEVPAAILERANVFARMIRNQYLNALEFVSSYPFSYKILCTSREEVLSFVLYGFCPQCF